MRTNAQKRAWNVINEQRRLNRVQATLETGQNWEIRALEAWDAGLNDVQKIAKLCDVSVRDVKKLMKREQKLTKLRGKLIRDTEFGYVVDHFEKLYGWKGFTKCDPARCPVAKQLPWLSLKRGP